MTKISYMKLLTSELHFAVSKIIPDLLSVRLHLSYSGFTVRSYGEQGKDLELEVDSPWNIRETRAHEETSSVHSLQRCAERPPRCRTHG